MKEADPTAPDPAYLQSNIFEFFEVQSPPLQRPIADSLVSAYIDLLRKKGHQSFFMISGCIKQSSLLDEQMSLFDFLRPCMKNNIINLPAPRDQKCLSYGVYDTLRRAEGLAKEGLKLEREGYYVLGQLAQIDEQRLKEIIGNKPPKVDLILQHLKPFGLSIEMYIPDWNRRFRYLPHLFLP